MRDHGNEIAEDDLPQIFDRFWRKDRWTSDGAGLGLGIVQRLADAHGGTVSVENAVDGGAVRVIFAPPCGKPVWYLRSPDPNRFVRRLSGPSRSAVSWKEADHESSYRRSNTEP